MNRLYQISAVCFFLLGISLKADPVGDYVTDDSTYNQGIRLLSVFPDQLSASQLEDCLRFLQHKFDHREAEVRIARQNDLADWLLQREATVHATAETLMAVIADEEADILWREYCLQKLPMAYRQAGLGEDIKAELVETLQSNVTDPRITFSGTSLLGLYKLRDRASLDPQSIIGYANTIIDSDDYSLSNHVTALQIAVLLGDQFALERARQLSRNESKPIQLRMSAIASVGQRGTFSDVPDLEPFLNHPDLRLRRAATTAIKNLSR